MIVTAQNGSQYSICDIEQKGCKLFGTDMKSLTQVLLGEYVTESRTSEVFAEAVCTNWNDKTSDYTMPER